ncbi:rhodanese-like domain-containing protein [Rhodonellum sp.]|uniref:rhodanese-like domain-containing protein n=1 Tax=Rhodonellum sp. TaxID=2231180 RepID=UPI0027186621|nr:rhodanese-like domain-containing protein [Rhodonellum sp.]MDO9551827.1 rhodanese-like domain-containing protein [Rhodonellum sp.]
MISLKTLYCVILVTCFVIIQGHAQSFGYRTLLKGFYDSDFPVIYPNQKELISKAVLLDTREKSEFEVSHLDNARWVGYDGFQISSVSDIPKNHPIVVYCTVGARSQEIGKKLKSEGFTQVYNLYGGIIHWVNESNPVFKEEKETEQVHTYSRMWGVWLKKGEGVF